MKLANFHYEGSRLLATRAQGLKWPPGASLAARDKNGWTAVDWARFADNPDLQNYIGRLQSMQNK